VGRDWNGALGDSTSDNYGFNKPGRSNSSERNRKIKGKRPQPKQNRLGLKTDEYKLKRREAQKSTNCE
jgi:hypothetical protein